MTNALAVSDVVNVSVSLSPVAAAVRNFGSLLIVGDSSVIDTSERIRSYANVSAVSDDFGSTAPEYLAAVAFFSQSPKPAQLYVGRWAQAATHGVLHGGPLSATEQTLATWTAITTGTMKITIDGVERALTGLNFSAAANMNGVASVINTAIASWGTCVWNSVYNRFDIKSLSTGAASAAATGTVTVTTNNNPADTVTINGTVITFVASGAVGNQVNIGAANTDTATNLLAFLQASTDANLVAATYTSASSTAITVTAVASGWIGNAITLAKSSVRTSISGATLTGGTGPASVSYATVQGSGIDVSAPLRLTAATNALPPVNGINAETLLAAVTLLAASSNQWYGLNVASTHAVDADHLAVAAFVEAATPSRIYGVTTQDSATLSGGSTSDLAYRLKAASYNRTFSQYSSSSPYAAASMFGRAFTVDFNANNSTITLKFKVEPGITAEGLTETQAAALKAKNCNAYVEYDNATAIIQEGVMASGYFFDEIHGTDWLQNDMQTAVYNLLYGANKIPQTDAGINRLVTVVSQSCERAVNNGLVAPGVWTGGDLGAIKDGQTLASGFYVFATPIALQNSGDRAARIAPTIQSAIKLAGAVHRANVVINVNR